LKIWSLAIKVQSLSIEFQTNTLIAMLTEGKVIEIFVMVDEFCKIFNAMLRRRGLVKTSMA